MNVKAAGTFFAQHYERIITVLVMLVFACLSILLLLKVNEIQTQYNNDDPPKITDVKRVDLKDLEAAYDKLTHPPTWESMEHLLFVGPMMKELEPGVLSRYIMKITDNLKTPEG